MSTFFLTAVLLLWRAHLSESAWNTDYAHAVRYVRSQDKPLLVLFDIANSGGAWDQLAVFHSERLDPVLVDDYVRLFVDLDTNVGRRLAGEFGVVEYPAMVVIERTGSWQVYRRSGFHSADELQSVLARFRRAKLVSTPGGSQLPVSTTSGPIQTLAAPQCKT